MGNIPKHWIEKAKNKSWFFSNYLKKIKGEHVEAVIELDCGIKFYTPNLYKYLEEMNNFRRSLELDFNGKKIWELNK